MLDGSFPLEFLFDGAQHFIQVKGLAKGTLLVPFFRGFHWWRDGLKAKEIVWLHFSRLLSTILPGIPVLLSNLWCSRSLTPSLVLRGKRHARKEDLY